MVLNTIIDAANQKHNPAGDGARILSLVPSLTELLFDMKLRSHIVGRTKFCIHPQPLVNAVPSVGGTKRINMKKVEALAPTHALVNIDETPKQMADALAKLGITVVVTHPVEVIDNRHLYSLVGALFNRGREAASLTTHFDAALAKLKRNFSPRVVLYLIWQTPWMTISRDTYISRFLSLGGWQTAAHDPASRYPEIKLHEKLLSKVDDVLFSTEPFPFTESHVSAFQYSFPNHAHKARLIDAEMVSWYGSRAIAGLEYLEGFASKVRQT